MASKITNGSYLKGAARRPTGILFGRGGTLGRTFRIATICRPRIRMAPVLMAHGYPALLIMRVIMMEIMTPPTDDPVSMMPIAKPRFFAK